VVYLPGINYWSSSENILGIIELAIAVKGMTMSYQKLLIYMICLFFVLTTILAGYPKVAPAAPGGVMPAGAGDVTPLPGVCSTGRGIAPSLATGTVAEQPDQPQIPPGVDVRLVVNKDQRTLTVMAGQEVIGVYPVAIGKHSTPTPIGEWKITDKDYDWGGAFGPRWLGLNISWGRYGIHGTNQPGSISYETSLGCLRMFDDDVLQIFDLVKVGTQVDIVGEPHKTNFWHRELSAGSIGPDAVYVQLALKRKGFYPYRCDGMFGRLSVLGVCCFQAMEGLPVTGKVDEATNRRLLEEAPKEKHQAPGNNQTEATRFARGFSGGPPHPV
jgi:lipoprotein-anchoring transpeptidase ErfK/SrfK